MNAGWGADCARRLRVGGSIEFTKTRIGQTLHVPCCKGDHKVDVTVAPGLAPEGVAKAMIAKGWTIGRKLTCPDCRGHKPKKDAMMPAQQNAIDAGTAAPAQPAPSDPAKRAYRMVIMALEDYYDETAKRYKPGHDDEKIAASTGASVALVKKTREDYFGPLAEPSEVAELKGQLATIRQETAAFFAASEKRIVAVEAKLTRLCTANGWLA